MTEAKIINRKVNLQLHRFAQVVIDSELGVKQTGDPECLWSFKGEGTTRDDYLTVCRVLQETASVLEWEKALVWSLVRFIVHVDGHRYGSYSFKGDLQTAEAMRKVIFCELKKGFVRDARLAA